MKTYNGPISSIPANTFPTKICSNSTIFRKFELKCTSPHLSSNLRNNSFKSILFTQIVNFSYPYKHRSKWILL